MYRAGRYVHSVLLPLCKSYLVKTGELGREVGSCRAESPGQQQKRMGTPAHPHYVNIPPIHSHMLRTETSLAGQQQRHSAGIQLNASLRNSWQHASPVWDVFRLLCKACAWLSQRYFYMASCKQASAAKTVIKNPISQYTCTCKTFFSAEQIEQVPMSKYLQRGMYCMALFGFPLHDMTW